LQRVGYVEGQNLVVQRWAGEGRQERYADLAREVVRLKPDLIFAVSTSLVYHLRAATTTIPIVALTSGDPVSRRVWW
jgi:putative ABC transport system substrate-binding protein